MIFKSLPPPRRSIIFQFKSLVKKLIICFLFLIQARALDLSNAAIIHSLAGPEQIAVRMLADEVQKRSRVQLPQLDPAASVKGPIISISLKPATPPEGFQISIANN